MNQLKYLTEFRSVLKNYRVSSQKEELFSGLDLVLLAGASSSGRNTIISQLLKTGKYKFIVSDTTRTPRVNDGKPEQNGVEYWFRSEADMLADLQAGEFLEAAIIHNQQVSGISLRELAKSKKSGKVAITDIEIVGVNSIMQAKPNTLAIFVVPPSFDEWYKRINARGQMDPTERKRRLQTSLNEFNSALDQPYYVFVVNDKLSDTVAEIDKLAFGKEPDLAAQAKNRELIKQICAVTANYLKTI